MDAPPRIHAGIFDIGGVLIANEPGALRRDIVATLAITGEAYDAAWAELGPLLGHGLISEQEFWARFCARTGAQGRLPPASSGASPAALGASRVKGRRRSGAAERDTAGPGQREGPGAESLFLREYVRRFRVHHDVLDLVAALKRRGLRLAVLSNTIEPHARYLRRTGLLRHFDVQVLSNEVGMSKPDPRVYRHTLRLLESEASPERVFFVDDLAENVAAAAALGIHGILFESGAQLRDALRALGLDGLEAQGLAPARADEARYPLGP
jgi:HAD superfamily hydrolase (TIGR01509 family)